MSDDAQSGDPVAAAQQHWQALCAERGEQDLDTLNALLTLSAARMTGGDPDNAIDGATQVLDARRAALGEQHPDTLTVAGLQTNWRYHRGDPGADEELRQLMPALTEILGAEHETTLWTRHTLAAAADAIETPAQRLQTWVELCGAETRRFGVKHELTLSALYGAAQARRELGDPFGASIDAMAVHSYRASLLGEHHPDTLIAWLGKCIWKGESLGITAHLLGEFDKLIPILQNVLGYDHRNTMLARYMRAAWTPGSADVVERVSEWEVLTEDLERAYGSDDHLSVQAREARDAGRVNWQNQLREIRDMAFDIGVDFEAERRDLNLDADRPWADPGDLDEEGVEEAEDFASEQESEMRDLMRAMVVGKRGFGDAVRSFGTDSEPALLWRYWMAWRLWSTAQFKPAAVRVRALLSDSGRVLGEGHPLTAASAGLAGFIEQQYRGGLSPYWTPEIDIDVDDQ